jgi:glucose/arabinose dehydrogenase
MQRLAALALIVASASPLGCRTTSPEAEGSGLRGGDELPPPPDAATAAHFQTYCVSCHGNFGEGQGISWSALAGNPEVRRRLDWDDPILGERERMPELNSEEYDALVANPAHRQAMLAALGSGGGSSQPPPSPGTSEIPGLILKAGFNLKVWATVPGARSLSVSPRGTVFVGTGGLGSNNDKVYAVRDEDGDGKGEAVRVLAASLKSPNGVAFLDGTLYIAEKNDILKLPNIEGRLDNPPAPQPIGVRFKTSGEDPRASTNPRYEEHYWKFLAAGPDGKLYTQPGAPCNICEPKDDYARLFRFGVDGRGKTAIAQGIRNSVGFTWHPVTRDLWFTDNGRDLLGDDVPADELNRLPASATGEPNYGFPFCHQGNVREPTPALARLGTCAQSVPPAALLEPHAAALGLRFYTGSMFPAEYRNQLFIAQRGSWNRSDPQPPRVKLVRLDPTGTTVVSQEDFIGGFQRPNGSRLGRPVDVDFLPDGSMLVSDATTGMIYRITYGGR